MSVSKIVVRCFRHTCYCKDYFKVNNCLPETRKDYEICWQKSKIKYEKTASKNPTNQDVFNDIPIWKNSPLL